MAAELYIKGGPGEGDTYVDLSCLEPPEMKKKKKSTLRIWAEYHGKRSEESFWQKRSVNYSLPMKRKNKQEDKKQWTYQC